jgi:hypothetical protein
MEEPELTWRRATRSGTSNADNCVEVAVLPDRVMVRDSKDATGPMLSVTRAGWAVFVRSLRG